MDCTWNLWTVRCCVSCWNCKCKRNSKKLVCSSYCYWPISWVRLLEKIEKRNCFSLVQCSTKNKNIQNITLILKRRKTSTYTHWLCVFYFSLLVLCTIKSTLYIVYIRFIDGVQICCNAFYDYYLNFMSGGLTFLVRMYTNCICVLCDIDI